MLNAPGEDVGPLAALQARWRSLPSPVDHQEPKDLRPAVEWMRDLIVVLRPRVAMAFENLPARGIAAGSQPLVLWKDRQYADHRTTYPGNALQLDMAAYAQTDPLLLVPASEDARARYEGPFTRFCALFPDRFYVSERGRMFLTNARDIASDAEGHRLLSAGFHSQMGYFRDDRPLYDLMLDEAQQRRAGWPLAGARLHHARARPAVQAVHLVRARRSAASWPPRVQPVPLRRRGRDVPGEDRAAGRRLPGQGAQTVADDVALEAVRDYFDTMNGERPRAGSGEGGRRTRAISIRCWRSRGGRIAGR